MSEEGLDWPGMMRAGLHGLGLKPAELWALTPIELLVMLGREGGGARALGRDRFEDLLRTYPDRTEGDGDG